jgi:hypothetical protein
MSVAQAHRPRVRHALRGRLRVHVPNLIGSDRHAVERRLGRLTGVRSVRANPLTDSVLIHFDPATTDEGALLAHLRALPAAESEPAPASARPMPLSAVLRLIGAAAGGLVLLARRLGVWSVPGGGAVAATAGALAAVASIPPARAALEQLLGPGGASLFCHLTDLLASILGADVLSLALQALDAFLTVGPSLAHVP